MSAAAWLMASLGTVVLVASAITFYVRDLPRIRRDRSTGEEQ
jgi:hypothetical protein